ncbi:hypothetical protein [Micromonospora coxensis]|uniref:SMI1 / KNR4 family (SUKH-1) n=1 Tax=Micromonospora coxensis TaxID=356852 RepID=A0A1C5JPG1_9ACTN|nr:hypothetical protein [Micromonospora coxensis]SCG72398.1 hypothetical protein GA0070614_4989 [Micromonospora coxensis]
MSAGAVTLPAVDDQLTWIDRIIDVTGWHQEPEDGAGWEATEAELGVALPTDFKELCRRFVPGSFYAYLDLLRPTDEHMSRELIAAWAFCRSESFASGYAPCRIYGPGKGPGLIQWGDDEVEGQYYWLADPSVEPDRWPVVARRCGDPWHRFDMPTTEFIHRMIADPEFAPFTVADPGRRAFYLPHWQTISTAEEWKALTDPKRESRTAHP